MPKTPSTSSGWYGTEKKDRVCAGCGEPMTLKGSLPVWYEDFPVKRWWHHGCKVATLPKP